MHTIQGDSYLDCHAHQPVQFGINRSQSTLYYFHNNFSDILTSKNIVIHRRAVMAAQVVNVENRVSNIV
jgi:hypothetical protein